MVQRIRNDEIRNMTLFAIRICEMLPVKECCQEPHNLFCIAQLTLQ